MTPTPLTALLPLTPLTPVASGATSAPRQPVPARQPGQRVVSPFYFRYLNDQASAIRARGGTDDDVNQFLDMEQGRPVALLPTTDDTDVPSTLRGVSMAVVQGATFGFGDEAVGAMLGAVTGIGARRGIEEYRREYDAWSKDHRGTAIVAELAGGLATGGLGGAAKAGVGRLAARAGAAGMIAGAGYSDGETADWNIGERARGAVLGGAAAATLGVAAGALGAVIKPIARPLVQKMLPKPILAPLGATPQERMRARLVHALEQDGLSLPEVQQRILDMRAQGIPASIMEVGGDATESLVRDALASRSLVRTRMLDDLRMRASAQGERLTAGLTRALFKGNRVGLANAYEVEDMLHTTMRTKAAPFYREAYSQTVELTPRMQHLLETQPKLREAWNRAAKLAADQDEVIAGGVAKGMSVEEAARAAGLTPGLAVDALPEHMDLARVLIARGVSPDKAQALAKAQGASMSSLPVRGFDLMKRELDVLVEEEIGKANPSVLGRSAHERLKRERGRALFQLRDELLGEVRQQVKPYGTATSIYSEYAGARDAVVLGRDFLRKAPEIVQREMRKLSPTERDFYRIGALHGLYNQVRTGGNVAKKVFGGELHEANIGRSPQAQRIRALFPADAAETSDNFLRMVRGEAVLSYRTGRVIRPPRAGAVQKAEQLTEGDIPSVRGTAGVTAFSAARQAIIRLRNRLTEEEADELADLVSKGLTNPDELHTLARNLFETYGSAVTRGKLRARVITTLGQRAGAVAAGEVR